MSEDEEEEDEQVPDEIPHLQGHLSRRSCRHHTSSAHFNQGNPPPSLNIQHGGCRGPCR